MPCYKTCFTCNAEGNEDDKGIKALVEALHSDEVKDFINDKYDGAVIPYTE